VLALVALLHGCDSGPAGLDSRRFPCEQDEECVSGYVCREGECQPEEPVDEPDAGRPDSGVPDSGVPDSGVPDAGPVLRPTQLAFATPPQTVEAGECSSPVEIETRSADGRAAPVAAQTSVALKARNNDLTFYSNRSCSGIRISVNVPTGGTRASFYFRGNTVGISPIDVSATGLADASQDEIIRAGPPTAVAFVSPAQTVPAGVCSAAVVLEARNALGTATIFTSPTAAGVTVAPAGGLTLFSDAACTSTITDATFAAGATRASFYFKGKTGGTFTLSPMPTGFTRVNQAATVLPVVRTGTCTLAAGALSVSCPITPPQRDVAKTLLLFQATSNSADSHSSNVRCALTNTSTVTCSRAGSVGMASVGWQTAELASGLKVQHLEASCVNVSSITVPIQPVASVGSTFLLMSSQADGTTLAADDFSTASLTAADRVEFRFGTACSTAWRGSLQVVEFTGASVTRGVTGPMTGTQLVVPKLPTVDLATTALLFTYRVSTASQPGICDRVLRGELTSPTSLTFSRSDADTGCEDATIEAISWERINLGARGQAQHLDFTLDDTIHSLQLPIPSAVDPTRTLVFASGQALSGQGGGETNYPDDDILGVLIARHTLLSPTLLEVSRDFRGDADARWFSTVLQLEP
jgi:hypothetical protein